MSAAAVIILRRRRFIRRFRELGATAPDRAICFGEVGMRRSWIFDQMMTQGVFVTVGEDRFYLHERVAEAFLAAQQQRAALITAAILLIVGLTTLLVLALR